MIEIYGLKVGYEVLAFLVAFALDEIIRRSPLKENSVYQLLSTLLATFKPARKEDEKVAAIAKAAEALVEAAKGAVK